MRPRLALALALLGLACQTTRVGREEEQRGEAPAAPEAPARRGPEAKARPGQPPVPAAPQGLIQDAGARKVREALAARGYLAGSEGAGLDAEASAALRRFQQEEGLAATGFADRETLRRLGLEPKEVYRDDGNGKSER